MTIEAAKMTTPDSILLQVIIGPMVWAKLTPVQRRLVIGHRTVIDHAAVKVTERYSVSGAAIQASGRTLDSLRRKGVVDDDGRLTWEGVYAALWGPPRERSAR